MASMANMPETVYAALPASICRTTIGFRLAVAALFCIFSNPKLLILNVFFNAIDHEHNSLVASVAQSVLVNSLKADENAFRRSESERNRCLEEIGAAIQKYRAERARQQD